LVAAADQLITAEVSPGAAVTAVGAPGSVAGVTGADSNEAGPVPLTLVAVTENWYAVPLVRPETVQESAPVVVQVLPPGVLVTE
jgi:hypothetical protein